MSNLNSVIRGMHKYAGDGGLYDANEMPAEGYGQRSAAETKQNTQEVMYSPTSPKNLGTDKAPVKNLGTYKTPVVDTTKTYEGDTWKGYLSAIRNNPGKFWGGFNGTDAISGGSSAAITALATSGMKNTGLRLLYTLLAGLGGAGVSRVVREIQAANQDPSLRGMTLPGKLQMRLTGTQPTA